MITWEPGGCLLLGCDTVTLPTPLRCHLIVGNTFDHQGQQSGFVVSERARASFLTRHYPQTYWWEIQSKFDLGCNVTRLWVLRYATDPTREHKRDDTDCGQRHEQEIWSSGSWLEIRDEVWGRDRLKDTKRRCIALSPSVHCCAMRTGFLGGVVFSLFRSESLLLNETFWLYSRSTHVTRRGLWLNVHCEDITWHIIFLQALPNIAESSWFCGNFCYCKIL